jgi:hypothetical protein
VLGADSAVQGPSGDPKGARGLGHDQASQGNVAGLDVPALLSAGRRPRRSRARFPPLTPEERSEINRRNATKHGNYTAGRRLTYELCERLVRMYHRQQDDLDRSGQDWREVYRRPPLEELCEEWRDDPWAMARYVLATHGPRTSRSQSLARVSDDEPWSPVNVEGYRLTARGKRKRDQRAAARRDPVGMLRGCVCDERAQEVCATSPHPCSWATAVSQSAPWLDPPSEPGD